MNYKGLRDFQHSQSASIGILLTNLGTPSSPTAKGLRPYLAQFLSDRRVVEIPALLWKPILYGIILNTRPAKSAKLYESIWSDQGSPLAATTQKITKSLNQRLKKTFGDKVTVDYAMRYGSPSIDSVVNRMFDRGIEKLFVLPLYPQYAGSTVGSTMDALGNSLARRRWVPELRFLNCYHDHPAYIDACAQRIKLFWENTGRNEKLLMSFHGLPEAHRDNGDPYFCQCHKTARLIAESLSLDEADYIVTFQSRFGKQEWLKPYTDSSLMTLARQGIKSVDVFCPGFAADCLETLEEIAVENRDNFINAGGQAYQYIPALNDCPAHIDCLEELCLNQCNEWLKSLRDAEATPERYQRIADNDLTGIAENRQP